MILQALVAYYERLLVGGAVQPPGFQEKKIRWVVELDSDGSFVALRRTGDAESRARKFVVPTQVKRRNNIAANLLWDNPEYVFGVARRGTTIEHAPKVQQRHAAFLRRLRDLPSDVPSDAGVIAIIAFLERKEFSGLYASEGWQELTETGANVSFKLAGEMDLVCQQPSLRAVLALDAGLEGSDGDSWCLVTGRRVRAARLHPTIMGIRGAQPTGANLVSFNLNAFTSHRWLQGANAPIGEAATHAYAAALTHLVARDNDHCHLIEGDTTFVFWAAERTPFEDRFADFLGYHATAHRKRGGTPFSQTFESVRNDLKSNLDDTTPFYVLGLAPNAARLAVRFWHTETVAKIVQNILAHFDDLAIVGLQRCQVPGLWRLLGAAARDGDVTKLQDQLRGTLAAGLMAAILKGLPYPATLLARTVERCRAEQSVRPVRAGLVKAVLNRLSPGREPTVSLDRDDPNPSYGLGRLLAVLGNIQSYAQGDPRRMQRDLGVTIRDRYFTMAMTAPRSAFLQLMRAKSARLKKLYCAEHTKGLAMYFDRQIDDILSVFSPEGSLPITFSLEDQARFIVGYHHQRNHRSCAKTEDKSSVIRVP